MAQVTMTQIREAYYTLLEAQRTATPALLRKNYRYRPGSGHEAPLAWIGDQIEDLSYGTGSTAIGHGIVTRVILTEVTIACPIVSDVLTTTDPMDELQDALRARFKASYNGGIANTNMELRRVESGEVTFRGTEADNIYRSLTFTLRHNMQEADF